jgi:hypothetical protein
VAREKVQSLNGKIFYSLEELRVLAKRWCVHYNTVRTQLSSELRTEKNFRRIMGFRERWGLKAFLSESQCATQLEVKAVA